MAMILASQSLSAPREWIPGGELENVARGANYDVAFKRQLASERGAQSGFTDILPHHKSSDSADIHDIELRQLLRDLRRAASIRSADIHGSEEDDGAHVESKKEELRIRK
jgi:hypothetical protein